MNSEDLSGAVGKGVQPPDGTTEPVAWLIKARRPGRRGEWATIDPDDNPWWPMDQGWVTVTRTPLVECGPAENILPERYAVSEARANVAEPSMSTTSPPDGSLPSEPSASDGGAAAMPQQPSAWVSVADRLPPDHRPVLAVWFSQMGTPFQHILSHWWTEDADRKSWRDYEGDGYFGITHWMPLPEPPQEAAAPLCHVSEPDGTKAPAPSIEGGAKP